MLPEGRTLSISDLMPLAVVFGLCKGWHIDGIYLEVEPIHRNSRLGYKQKDTFQEAIARVGNICLFIWEFYWFSKRVAYNPNLLIKNLLITRFYCIYKYVEDLYLSGYGATKAMVYTAIGCLKAN
jgi:hypothetical protein